MPITLNPQTASLGARTCVPPLVIAHRGASEQWPENTIPAFSAGIDQGADMIEIDVHLSRDGELVVIHDATLERTTDARTLYPDRTDLSVGGMNAPQIATLDAGSWKGEQFAGVRVPRLGEVLDLVHTTRTGLLLEVKHPFRYPGIAEVLARSLQADPLYLDRALAAGMLVVQSADWGFVREFHELLPEIPVGVLGRPCPDELYGFADWVDQVNPEYLAADIEYLGFVHQLGMSSLVWTIDSDEDMEKAIDAGSDGIITNVPDRLIALIDIL